MTIRIVSDPNNDPNAREEWFRQREIEDLERGLVAARLREPKIDGEEEAVLEKLAAFGVEHKQKTAAKRPRAAAKKETR